MVNSLWRAIAVFRIGALGYAAYIVADGYRDYARPGLGLVVLAGMALWTAATTWAYHGPARRGWPLLLADFAVTAAALYASRFVIEPERLARGAQTLTLAAKVRALLGGRYNVSFEDIRRVYLPALRHRVILNFEAEAEGIDPDKVLTEILQKVPEKGEDTKVA